jgi:aminoglycoside phosphotransferase family enzyme
MDLDAFGRQDLSDLFLKYYNDLFPCMMTEEDYRLFVFYKSYRSNIRAKVNSLRARGSRNVTEKRLALADAEKYLSLMDGYILKLDSK